MKLSTIIFLVLSLLFGVSTWWNVSKTSGIFYGDALGYHSYLPAAFINGNLTHVQDLALDPTIDTGITDGMKRWKDSYAVNAKGNVIMQYTYANALMNAPFFLIGHIAAHMFSYPINGFSLPYLVSIKFAGIFYALVGFLLLYQVLLHYYNKDDVVFGLTAFFIGTNLFWFVILQSGMAHVNVFFLYALLIYASHKYYQSFANKWIVLAAFTLGMLTVIRPTDIIAIFIPLLYGVNSLQAFKNRFNQYKINCKSILILSSFFFLLPILPQFVYWYVMTGEIVYYSYSDQGFNWTHPEIVKGLFGPRNGWITYSPLLLVPLVVLFILKRSSPVKWLNWVMVPLYIYIAYSWWCFNYINGFGSRPMIHLYPLLAFPMIYAIVNARGRSKAILKVAIVLLALVNVNYTLKAIDGRLVTDESTHAFNFATFFKNTINYKDLVLRDTEIKQPKLLTPKSLSEVSIKDSSLYAAIFDGKQLAFIIGPNTEFAPFSIEHTITAAEIKDNKYITVGGEFMAPELVYNMYEHHILTLAIERNGKAYKWYGVKLNNKIGKTDDAKDTQIQTCIVGEWGEVFFTIPTSLMQEGDMLKSHIWNPKKKTILVRSFSMEVSN